MSAEQQVGALAARMKRAEDGAAWEKAVIELAERGDARFVEILRRHVERGVIRSDRARAAITPAAVDAAA